MLEGSLYRAPNKLWSQWPVSESACPVAVTLQEGFLSSNEHNARSSKQGREQGKNFLEKVEGNGVGKGTGKPQPLRKSLSKKHKKTEEERVLSVIEEALPKLQELGRKAIASGELKNIAREDIRRVWEERIKPKKNEPLIPDFNYHALGEKIANEALLLSVHPVCEANPETAERVQKIYAKIERTIKAVGKLKALKGEWSKPPQEMGLAALAWGRASNAALNMIELYHIKEIPALLEAEDELFNRQKTLGDLGIRIEKSEKIPDPEIGN